MATTTNYSWTTPNDSDPFRNGASAIRTLGSSIDTTLFTALGGAYPGMRLVKTQAIGSAVGSVVVTGAFSATYGAYKIIIVGGVGSAAGSLQLQFGASTASYNGALPYITYSTNTQTNLSDNAAAAFRYIGATATNVLNFEVDVVNPFLAQPTTVRGNYSSATLGGQYTGYHNVATSYTGFTITPNSGTLTGGTIYVYGYGMS